MFHIEFIMFHQLHISNYDRIHMSFGKVEIMLSIIKAYLVCLLFLQHYQDLYIARSEHGTKKKAWLEY